MPLYRLRRHVIYEPGCQQTAEVWGVDRPFPASSGLVTVCAPTDTDADDPLRARYTCCRPHLLRLPTGGGHYVKWGEVWEWLSAAETAGYEVVSGFKKMSPYSVIVLRGP